VNAASRVKERAQEWGITAMIAGTRAIETKEPLPVSLAREYFDTARLFS